MNNAKMWLVVSPSVGVPVFLGAVAVGSFAVHLAVLSKTNWYSDYLVGDELGSGDMASNALVPEANTAQASYALPTAEGTEVTVIMPDGTTARAVIMPNDILASAEAPPLVQTD